MAVEKSSSVYIICGIISAIALAVGFVIGYLVRPQVTSLGVSQTTIDHHEPLPKQNFTFANLESCGESTTNDPQTDRYLANCESNVCQATSCYIPVPSTYVVYHLNSQTVQIDGRLDEQAWKDVPWSRSFVDIKGFDALKPKYETKMKLRYDDVNLYLAFYLEEDEVWANITKHDGAVYGDNSVQILIDTKQNNHKYKEIVINSLGTVSDIMMTKPYIDDGEQQVIWESEVKRSIYVDGSVNNASKQSTFWTLEMAIPFKSLFFGVKHGSDMPADQDIWRANFVRVEHEVEISGSKYLKKVGGKTDLWQWYSNGVINSHLPDIWGLLQFRKAPVNSTEFQQSKYWLLTNILSELFRAEKAYKAVTGRYTDKLELLNLPPYTISKQCIQNISVKLDWSGFQITVTPRDNTLKPGHIRTDRLLWFGDDTEEVF
ncbi:hypothetical protein LOTGIDRAFT_164341 [Lottia gigantea]|uniref:Carbohydrate-binding domain-containing protein n=1 Tax=Lottia gigantea TaxID=225164 RepID=V4A9S4_LOTGI|nr:hypothetical protein LOTGIDRAFT_164341 [Lottia gigantea]ESO90041.1 hypothetical protein LOTGIDRAFT_164341 [Lottia gigantea]